MKGYTPTVGIGLRRIISKKFDILSIDEYNTSKKCCNCWKDLENKEIDGKVKFRLLVCKNCEKVNIGSSESKCPMFITRDLNSCVNMVRITKHMLNNNMKRPAEFSRIKDDKKPKKKLRQKSDKKSMNKSKIKKLSPLSKKEKGGKSVVFTEGKASNL